MQAIKTIDLPFMSITLTLAPAKVQHLDELPDYVLPFKATRVNSATEGRTEDEFGIALDFNDIDKEVFKDDLIKSNGLQEEALSYSSSAFLLTQEALKYTLNSAEVDKAIRNAVRLDKGRVPVLKFTSLQSTVRRRGTGRAVHAQTLMQQMWEVARDKAIRTDFTHINFKDNDNGVLEPTITMSLTGGVVLVSRSVANVAPLDSANRITGLMSVGGREQNFYITRPRNPSVFLNYLEGYGALQDAYQFAKDEIEGTVIGKVLHLPDQLMFIGTPDVKLEPVAENKEGSDEESAE